MAHVETVEQCNILNWCYSMCCSGVEYHYFVDINISVLFYHVEYYYYWHVYIPGYPIWTTDLGFLKL